MTLRFAGTRSGVACLIGWAVNPGTKTLAEALRTLRGAFAVAVILAVVGAFAG